MLAYSRDMNGNIPLSEILAYTDHFELIGSKKEFISAIRIIDTELSKARDAEKEGDDSKE